jgi:hypothetical protein
MGHSPDLYKVENIRTIIALVYGITGMLDDSGEVFAAFKGRVSGSCHRISRSNWYCSYPVLYPFWPTDPTDPTDPLNLITDASFLQILIGST